MLVPCRPPGVVPDPEAAEPLIRSQIGTIVRVLPRSGVCTKLESGTSIPLSFGSSFSTTIDGALKRSSQTTSLETRRSACEASSAPAAAASFDPCVRSNASASPARPRTLNCERLDRRLVGFPQRPGRIELFGARDAELLLADEARELCLQLRRLDALRRQRIAQLAADTFGLTRDGRHARHVVVVRVPFLVLLAALRPQQQQHDDQDREGDQAEQAQQRREAGTRADRAAWLARAAPASQSTAQRAPGRAFAPGSLPGVGLLEKIELEVWFAFAHGFSRVERGHCNRWFGRRGAEGFGPAAAKPAEAVSTAAHALPRRELVLDRYRPLRPLGSGGSGSVWLARDEQTGLDVALKIVPREGKAADRAEREAEAASRLRHERCLRAYGFGSDAGHVYIAYEYVGGRTLRDAMRAGELRDGQAIEAAAQILDGLAHAHSRGIVHRDVKPSNVLLADDEGISVRLLDFGLAQFDEAETLTAVGDVPGTLAYISPERLCGQEACAASDVWGVGILLWEALAAKHPFWGVPLRRWRARSRRARRRSRWSARTCRSACSPRSATRSHATRPSARPPPRSRRSCAPRLTGGGVRRRSKVLFQHKLSSNAALPAAATGLAAGVGAAMLPFYPSGGAAAIAVVSAVTAFRSPRAGLALALAAPVFPLGNVALGLALAYGAVALAWLVLFWRDARFGLAFVAGPLLAPLGLLALVPSRSPAAAAQPGGRRRRWPPSRSRPSRPACAAGTSRSGKARCRPSTWTAPKACRRRHNAGRSGSRGPRPRGARARRGRCRAPVCPHTVADRRSGPARWRRSSSPRRPRRRCRSSQPVWLTCAGLVLKSEH